MFISKGLKALGIAVVPILIFSQTAMASPQSITYENNQGSYVSVSYLNVLANSAMYTAFVKDLSNSESSGSPIYITDSNGPVIDYEAAITKGYSYSQALSDSTMNKATAPTATYQMNLDGSETLISGTSGTGSTLPAQDYTVTENQFIGETFVTVTINPANVSSVKSVTVNGQVATQDPTVNGLWRVVLPTVVAQSALVTTVATAQVQSSSLINVASSSATYVSMFGQTRVLVSTTSDVTSVTVGGTAATKNSSGLWQLDVGNTSGTVAVVATNGTTTDTETLTIQQPN